MGTKYHLSTSAVCILLSAIVLRLLTNRYKRVLRDIPGPVLARYSRLWKLYSVWKGDHHHVEIDLHRKHGSLVRIGPNHISVSDPSAIPLIYGLNKGFTKVLFIRSFVSQLKSSRGSSNNAIDWFLPPPIDNMEQKAPGEHIFNTRRCLSPRAEAENSKCV